MKYTHPITTLLIALTCITTTQATPFDTQTKITASDATAHDAFGYSMAISGNIAIIGASNDESSGSAYLFDTTTGNQLFKLNAADAASHDSFGSSVGISSNTAIIGAPGNDDAGDGSGSAYLFDTTTGNQLFKLNAADAKAVDTFGSSVAISGITAIIGAPNDDDAGLYSGSAYLFNVTTGDQLFKLNAADAAANDRFGGSVAISGDIAIISAFLDDDGGSDSGSVYLFNITTGNQIAKLNAEDAAYDDHFGGSVAISGNIAIIGANGKDDGSTTNSGSAYLFDITTGNQLFKLTADDAAQFDQFGNSVAISGNIAIVGASGNNDAGDHSGSAYLFDITTGNQIAKLIAADSATQDWFGGSVAINDNTAIVGAYADDDGGTNSGSAYIFKNIIPEPTTLALLTLAAAPLLKRRKK